MTILTWTIQVARAPEDVFAYVADFERHHEWSPKPYRIEGHPGGPAAVGTRFRSIGWIPRKPENVNDVEITKVDPPNMLAWDSRESDQVFRNELRFEPADGGTRVTRTLDAPEPSGALRLVMPLLNATVIRPGVQKGMVMLKQRLES